MWFGIESGLECMAMGYSEVLQGDCAVRANTMGYDDVVDTGAWSCWQMVTSTRLEEIRLWYLVYGMDRLSVGLSGYGHKKGHIISIYSFIQEKNLIFLFPFQRVYFPSFCFSALWFANVYG